MSQSMTPSSVRPAPSKWRYVFIVLTILQLMGAAGIFSILQSADDTARSGASGSEFIALFALALLPFLGLFAFVSLVGLIIYIIKRKPHSVIGWIAAVVSLLISAILVALGAYILYQTRVVN